MFDVSYYKISKAEGNKISKGVDTDDPRMYIQMIQQDFSLLGVDSLSQITISER